MKRSSVRASLTTGATCAAADPPASGFRRRGRCAPRRSAPPARPAARRGRSAERPETIGTHPRRPRKILEARMVLRLAPTATGTHLLGHQPGQTFVQRHAQRADALRTKAERRGQHQVGAIRLQQIGRADIGARNAGRSGATTFISVSAGLPPSAASALISCRVSTSLLLRRAQPLRLTPQSNRSRCLAHPEPPCPFTPVPPCAKGGAATRPP